MTGHARLSASAAHRWMKCAGSVGGESKPSIHAATGTFAHSIAAACLATGTPASDHLCETATVDGFEVECGLEMVDGVQVYIDAIEADLKEGDKGWIEMELTEDLRQLDQDFGGTADYVRYRPSDKSLRVWDFKYGAGVYVEADDNTQMKVYAVGALLHAMREGCVVESVEVTVVQPRFEGAKPVRSWTFPTSDVLDFVADIREAAAMTRLAAPPLAAGDHCGFCAKRATCPELERRQHALMAADFPVVGEIGAYAPAELAKALAAIPLVKERIKAIEELAYNEAMAGKAPPGFKLVDKRPTRKWKSEGDVIEWAQAQAIDPYAPRELLSVAQLEKKVSADAPRGKKKEAGKVLEPFIEKVSSGYALVPESDDRQPARLVQAADFEALT